MTVNPLTIFNNDVTLDCRSLKGPISSVERRRLKKRKSQHENSVVNLGEMLNQFPQVMSLENPRVDEKSAIVRSLHHSEFLSILNHESTIKNHLPPENRALPNQFRRTFDSIARKVEIRYSIEVFNAKFSRLFEIPVRCI
jgi:hypothetical protein